MVVSDISYVYILTNLIGMSLLMYVFNKREQDRFGLTNTIYLIINSLLLGFRVLDIGVTSIPLTSFFSYLNSFFIVICFFYNIIYPLILFSELLKEKDIIFNSSRTNILLVNSALFCLPLLIVFFFLFPALVPTVVFIIVILECANLIQLQFRSQSIQT